MNANRDCHVLYVEDHPGDAMILERIIDRIDCDVRLTQVSDGESALEYLHDKSADRPVDIVLLDLMLPGMQGPEVLERIRADDEIRDTPVIALTSSRDGSKLRACRQRGVNACLRKDDGPAVLCDRLARVLGLWCQEAANTVGNAGDITPFPGRAVAQGGRRGSDMPPGRARSRVLIVDDSAPDADMMARYLEPIEKLEVVTASETREADALLRNERFDVVLLDYRMPGRSGLDYIDVIRRRDPDVGIVMVTAFSDEKVAIRSIRRRVDDYLRKEDLTSAGLVETVEELLVRVRRRRTSVLDSVTGLLCGEALEERLDEACERLRAQDDPFGLLLLDLDEFSAVNVQHGRASGDRVLRRVARVLPDVLRSVDIAGRCGGDEFCIIAPSIDIHRAGTLGERVRDCIRRLRFDYGEGEFTLDCTVGVAHFDETAPPTPSTVLAFAHQIMRDARSTGGEPIRIRHFRADTSSGDD